MNSQKAITIVQGLIQTYSENAQAFQIVLDVLNNGYQTDQVRIDAEIQKDKDARTVEIGDLTSRAIKAEDENAVLKQQLVDAGIIKP